MNQLQYEKSPYLRQHMENPVNWYPWSREAFEKAKEKDKPIFLSIGYSTCHWCHVMAHESFEDAQVAEILNESYISIKVDREERSDVDAVYMSVCQALTGSGGWPLTILMTPDQKPFFAGTYFPKRKRYGQPGLVEILQQIAELWKDDRERLLEAGNQIQDFMRKPEYTENSDQTKAVMPEKKLLEQAFSSFRRQYDKKWGGFGRAPKFPMPHDLMFLFRYSALAQDMIAERKGHDRLAAERDAHNRLAVEQSAYDRSAAEAEEQSAHDRSAVERDAHNRLAVKQSAHDRSAAEEQALQMAESTLTAMACGGIFDHIGGGFSRYSTDEKWLVPHFEKMLYDNALLAIAYLEAWQAAKNPLFEEVAVRTLDYMLRELSDAEGGFYCGQDADSDGEEGKYYLFTKEEVIDVLGQEDGEEFCRNYDITTRGNFEGKSIPNRIGYENIPWKSGDERLNKLYEYRKKRTKLHTDDKIILSWNAWAICAFARAGRILERKEYLDAAIRAHKFVQENMSDQAGRLFLRWREGEAAHKGTLDDYAVYGLASLELYDATFEPKYLREAVLRGKQILEFFGDEKQGGYFLTASDAEALLTRPKEVYDGALPSGNSVAAVLFGRLGKYTGEIIWQEVSESQNSYLAGVIGQHPFGHSFGMIALAEALYPSREVLCALPGEETPKGLKEFLKNEWSPNFFVLVKTRDNTEALAKIAPFTRSYPLPKQDALYYLCENGVCSAPRKNLS